jgi:PmbA protein
VESSQSEGVALRLWQNSCPGLAVAYGDFNPEELIAKALAISALNPAEEIELNQQNKLIYPAPTSAFELRELIELGKQTIALITEQYPQVICEVDLDWQQETTTLVNSHGLYCQYGEVSYSASVGVEWVKGDDFLGIYDGKYSHQFLDLTVVIERILTRLRWAEENVTVKSGKMPILFTPHAITMFWETVSDAVNGKRILEQSSPWAESLGKKVISACLSLSQKPDFAPYNCPFDDEGTPTQTLNLIESGHLQNFYCDRQIAKKLGINNTGNGFRPSLGSYPSPDLVNLVVNSGHKSGEELLQSLNQGLIVDQLLGDSADISGDFSVNIDLGFLVNQGEIQGRIKDTMLAGNVYQALNKVGDLGNDLIWSGSYYTPSVIIDDLYVVS